VYSRRNAVSLNWGTTPQKGGRGGESPVIDVKKKKSRAGSGQGGRGTSDAASLRLIRAVGVWERKNGGSGTHD